MRMHVVETADSANEAPLPDTARFGRAAAMARRRALAAGRSALAPVHERRRTGPRDPYPRAPVPAAAGPAAPAPDGRWAPSGAQPSGAQRTPAGTPVALNGQAAGRLGRAMSMQRRRQLSQGKQALNGGSDPTAAGRDPGPPTLVVHRGGAH